MAAARPAAVVISASEMPGATARKVAAPAVPSPWKASMMPQTVPNNPTNGVTAPVLQSGIEVSVPKTRTVKEITEERMVISINKQQRVFLGNDPVNINEIKTKLRQKIRDPQNQSVFIRADEDVPFGAFATVMDAIKGAGITNVSIVTQPLDQNGSKR